MAVAECRSANSPTAPRKHRSSWAVSWLHRAFFFFSSRRRHTRYWRDWSSDVCSSDLMPFLPGWGKWVLVVGAAAGGVAADDEGQVSARRKWREIGRASCRERV